MEHFLAETEVKAASLLFALKPNKPCFLSGKQGLSMVRGGKAASFLRQTGRFYDRLLCALRRDRFSCYNKK